jgi:hypothetical protein
VQQKGRRVEESDVGARLSGCLVEQHPDPAASDDFGVPQDVGRRSSPVADADLRRHECVPAVEEIELD